MPPKKKSKQTNNDDLAADSLAIVNEVQSLVIAGNVFHQSTMNSQIIDSLARDNPENAKHLFLLAKSTVIHSAQFWLSLVQWTDNESNFPLIKKLLGSIYPEKMKESPPATFEEARVMISDGFVYDVLRDLSRVVGASSKSIKEAYERNQRVTLARQASAKHKDCADMFAAMDLLQSVRNECRNFKCKAYPVVELVLTQADVNKYLADNKLSPREDWAEDRMYLHHFDGLSVIGRIYNLNRNGAAERNVENHHLDPQWRCYVLVLCDKLLRECRDAKFPTGASTARLGNRHKGKKFHKMKKNRFDVRLTGPQVDQCCAEADVQYWKHQSKVNAPAKQPWYLHEYYHHSDEQSSFPALPWREADPDEDQELAMLMDHASEDDSDGNNSSSAQQSEWRKNRRRKQGGKPKAGTADPKNRLIPIDPEHLYRIFPQRGDEDNKKDRYLHLSVDLSFMPSSATEKVEVEILASHLAMLAISHMVNKIGLPLDLLLKVGPECREQLGIYAFPVAFDQERTVVTPHIWTTEQEKAAIRKQLSQDPKKHIIVGSVAILGFDNMLSRDFTEADLLIANKSSWDADSSGAQDSVIRSYVDMSLESGLTGNDHEQLQSFLSLGNDERPIVECYPRMSVGLGAVVLAQAAQKNELARMKIAREWLDLVTLVTNEFKRLILFQQTDQHMGRWVELYDCGLTYSVMMGGLSKQAKLNVTNSLENQSSIQYPLHSIGLMSKTKAQTRDQLFTTLYHQHAFLKREQRQHVVDLDPTQIKVYKMLNNACDGNDNYVPGAKSNIRGGIDKALNAFYGPHGDKDTCMNKNQQTKNKRLSGLSDMEATLPTAHDMTVLTFCRGFPNCTRANATIYHGQVNRISGQKQPCTMVETKWNGGHFQGKRAQVQGVHWSVKEKETTANAPEKINAKLELSAGLPETFIREWLPEYYNHDGVININFRLVSTMREVARGGIDFGLYAAGLLLSIKRMWNPNRNYNQGNYTNVFFNRESVDFSKLPKQRQDWHLHFASDEHKPQVENFVRAYLDDHSGDGETGDQDSPSQFPFIKHRDPPPKPNRKQWPNETQMNRNVWLQLHQSKVDMKTLFGETFAEVIPPDGIVKGICLPTQTMRYDNECWKMAMDRSISELCVNHNITMQLVKDEKKGTLAESTPLMVHSGRCLPIPIGVVVDRSGTGDLNISSRSSDIIDLKSKATLLLTQLYKQLTPDRTDWWILFSFLWDHYFSNTDSKFSWNHRECGYPAVFTGKSEKDILPMLQEALQLMFPDKTAKAPAKNQDVISHSLSSIDHPANIPAEMMATDSGEDPAFQLLWSDRHKFQHSLEDDDIIRFASDYRHLISLVLDESDFCNFKRWDRICLLQVLIYVPLVKLTSFVDGDDATSDERSGEILNRAVSLAILMLDNYGIHEGDPEDIVKLAVDHATVTIHSFSERIKREEEFLDMLELLPAIERLLFQIYTLLCRYPMHLCGSAGSAIPEGEKSISSGSSQEDATIRAASGQSLNSDVNMAIASCREMSNALTLFVNLDNWKSHKRKNDLLRPVMQQLKRSSGDVQNQFMCLGHPYIGKPLPDKYDLGAVRRRFSNYPGFVNSNMINMSYLLAGVLAYESPPAFQFETEVKITRDWYDTNKSTCYRSVPVNFHGVGPMFEVDVLMKKSLFDFNEPLFSAVQRNSANAFVGAVCSDMSKTLRHVYWMDSIDTLLRDLGGLAAEADAASPLSGVTREARRLRPYMLQDKMTGICKNFMGAAALRANPERCTLPLSNVLSPDGSHIPLPLCFRNSEKLAHSLREKPMPCSLRETDVGVSHCRYNHKLLVTSRNQATLFLPKVVQFHESYYPTDHSQFSEEEKQFYSSFQVIFPKEGASFDDVFEVPVCTSKDDALLVCASLADMIFMNVVSRIGGNVPFLYGYPEFKREVYSGTDPNIFMELTLPTRFEAGVYAHYCASWVAIPGVTPTSIISDQHTAQVPRTFRDGARPMAQLTEFLVGFSETCLASSDDAYGMKAIERFLESTYEGGQFLIKRSVLVSKVVVGIKHYCTDLLDENAKFLASQVVADLESTVPGICGPIESSTVHTAWGGKFGISRFGKKKRTFAGQLEDVHQETLKERIRQAAEAPIELALQGYAKLADSMVGSNGIVNLRTFAPYSLKDTEHEGCKAGTGVAQAHTTRTVSQQRTQNKICAHPVPGTESQRLFLVNTLKVFGVVETALEALEESKVVGDYPQQMHYYKPCWYHSGKEGEAYEPFAEPWYTWAELDNVTKSVGVKRKARVDMDE